MNILLTFRFKYERTMNTEFKFDFSNTETSATLQKVQKRMPKNRYPGPAPVRKKDGDKSMIRNVIFDVDGTLWDSARQVTAAWQEVLDRHPETKDVKITVDDMYRYMGHTMYEISCMMLPGISEELRALIMQDCMENEDLYLRAHSGDFYPGCMETIERLHEEGYRVYIVSNCQDGYIETLIEDAGWILGPVEVEGDVQDFECYGRTGKKKGSNIRLLMERNGLPKESCVYVGDTAMDEAGAAQAGIRFIYASYGFGTVANPKAVIHEISELPEALQRLSK